MPAYEWGDPELQRAVETADTKRVQQLLDAGVVATIPDAPNHVEFRPLREAILRGHVDIVRLLLEHGASPFGFESGMIRYVPRSAAAVNEDTAATEKLIDLLLPRYGQYRASALYDLLYESLSRFPWVTRLALDKGANPFLAVTHRYNPWTGSAIPAPPQRPGWWQAVLLYEAICNRNCEALELLLSFGIDPNLVDGIAVRAAVGMVAMIPPSKSAEDVPQFLSMLLKHGARVSDDVLGHLREYAAQKPRTLTIAEQHVRRPST